RRQLVCVARQRLLDLVLGIARGRLLVGHVGRVACLRRHDEPTQMLAPTRKGPRFSRGFPPSTQPRVTSRDWISSGPLSSASLTLELRLLPGPIRLALDHEVVGVVGEAV